MENSVSDEYQSKVLTLQDKFQRIAELKKRLDEEEYLLMKQCMKLTKEKALYAQKLNDITAIGNNMDWEERSKLLEKIKPLIDRTKEKLKGDLKPVGGDANKNSNN